MGAFRCSSTSEAVGGTRREGHPFGCMRRGEQQAWLLDSVLQVWEGFTAEFRRLWRSPARAGDAHPASLYSSSGGGDSEVRSRTNEHLVIYMLPGVHAPTALRLSGGTSSRSAWSPKLRSEAAQNVKRFIVIGQVISKVNA